MLEFFPSFFVSFVLLLHGMHGKKAIDVVIIRSIRDYSILEGFTSGVLLL